MSEQLQIGAWYHFWSTTVHQGVMDYGQLVKVLDGFCTFTNAVRTTSVPVEFVVSESAPCVTEGRVEVDKGAGAVGSSRLDGGADSQE